MQPKGQIQKPVDKEHVEATGQQSTERVVYKPEHGAAMGHVPVHAVPTLMDPHHKLPGADPGSREAADLVHSSNTSLLHTKISILSHLWYG